MLPNFLIPGFAKCGTTSLHYHLGRHPQIFMSEPKEPHFFSREEISDADLRWYRSLFEGVTVEKAVGESSPSYTTPALCRRSAQRIANHIPSCRLIFLVRDPLARLESEWRMRARERWASIDIMDAIKADSALVETGLYWHQIDAYRSLFPDDRILVVFLENLTENPQHELRRCYRHLGVDDTLDTANEFIALNTAEGGRRPRKVFASLVQSRISQSVRVWLPSLHNLAKRLTTTEFDADPVWDPGVRDHIIERYQRDASQLFAFCGQPSAIWSFGKKRGPSG